LSIMGLSEYCCRKDPSLDEYGLETNLHHWPESQKNPAK
jgi:hypothetical protein